MATQKLFFNISKAMVLLLFLAIGIALFFMREEKMPIPVGHELTIRAKRSSERIVSDQFLILIHPTNITMLKEILEPLALELKMPILNWLLVGRKGIDKDIIVSLNSDSANESRLTLNSLLQHPYVLDAQHNYVVDPTTVPKNWSFANEWQWHKASSYSPFPMDISSAWDITEGREDITIAVVDQFTSRGLFTFKDHFSDCNDRVIFFWPFLKPLDTYQFDPLPHGELMLQALGACTNKSAFSAGVNWHSPILAVERPSLGHAETFIAALLASQINICEKSIVSCPNGFFVRVPEKLPDILLLPFGNDAPDLLQFSTDMISAIRQKNVIVVTSAGNDRSNAQNFFPGGSPNVINVGAINKSGNRASFSNWGQTIDLLAPGDDIELSYPNGTKKVAGTSIASAYVAGAISLIKSIDKNLSFKEIERILVDSAHPLTCEQYCGLNNSDCKTLCCQKNMCGKLALDINNAVHLAKKHSIMPPLLALSNYYLLYLRDETGPKEISVSNEGSMDAYVEIKAFDANIKITPTEIWLAKKGDKGSKKSISISFHKEPFIRQTHKIMLTATNNSEIFDRAEFYIEYIPKK